MKLKLIPFICAEELPNHLEEYGMEQDWPLHYSSGIVQVSFEGDDPMEAWLKEQGYQFSPEEIERGWGHFALMGS